MAHIKLKYIGNGEYIVGIPARDLTDYDLLEIAQQIQSNEDETISMLTASGLYEEYEKYICPQCDKEFKTWDGMNKHVLKQHQTVIEEEHNDNSTESI